MVDCGLGAAEVNNGLPTKVNEFKSVRTSFARRIAPSRFNSPAPCSSILKPASGCAVYIKIILIMFGVRLGLASSSTAAAPATIGLETEVPLRRIRFDFPGTARSGFDANKLLFGDASPMILFPGAARSGLIKLSWWLTPAPSTQ